MSPCYIGLLVDILEETGRFKTERELKFEILHRLLELMDVSHANFWILEKELSFLRRIIGSNNSSYFVKKIFSL
jgi:hypothetical protein